MRVLTAVLVLSLALVCSATKTKTNAELINTLGDGLWRTFSDAIKGDAPPLPLTVEAAKNQGWQAGAGCQQGLGVPYFLDAPAPSGHHPLGLFFTTAGQIAGVSVTIYGRSISSPIGPAAQPNLVSKGFWIKAGFHTTDTWYTTLSFRASELMCSGQSSNDLVGDRLILNQHTIAFEIPLTAAQARAQGYAPGSCMKTMGQHHFLDLKLGNGQQGWVEGDLLPIVPMYYPPGDAGVINAVFFTTPVAQPGSYLFGHGDWETPALINALMCQNWCDSNCHWTTHIWSTMHIYFNSQWKTLTCTGGSGLVGRACY